jgi:hypothetical protein
MAADVGHDPHPGRSFDSSVGISDKMCFFVGIWAVAAVVSSKRARTIATILCTEMRLTDLRLHKSSQRDRPRAGTLAPSPPWFPGWARRSVGAECRACDGCRGSF